MGTTMNWTETGHAVPADSVGDPQRLLDAWFRVAAETLEAQRELSKAVLGLGGTALDAATTGAQRAMTATEQYTRAAAENAEPQPSASR